MTSNIIKPERFHSDPFEIVSMADFVASQLADPEACDPLIEDVEGGEIVGAGQIGILYGAAGSFKTALKNAFNLAVATGEGLGVADEPQNYKSKKGRVLSAIFEDPLDYARRVKAVAEQSRYDLASLDWGSISANFDICEPKDRLQLVDAIKRDANSNGAPALFDIDTVSAAVRSASLNDDSVIGHAFDLAQRIRDEFGATVLLLMHPGKDAGKGIAGSYRSVGNADFILKAVSAGTTGRLVSEKSRRSGSGKSIFTYEAAFPMVGRTVTGRPVTAAIIGRITPADRANLPEDTSVEKTIPRSRLNHAQQLALEKLEETIIDHGIPTPTDLKLPTSVTAVVSFSHWREAVLASGIISDDVKSPRGKFHDLKAALLRKKAIGGNGDYVWIA